jgi:copper resistance protein B
MNTNKLQGHPMTQRTLLAALLLSLGTAPAWAQNAAPMPMSGMDNEQMDHGQMDHGTMHRAPAAAEARMPAVDHSMHAPAEPAAMPGMNHDTMPMEAAPPDARDPHAYSGGNTLTTGAYVLDGPRMMHTADEMPFATVLFNRLERVDSRDASFTAWDATARFGKDFDALVVNSEGEYADGALEHARTELLWSHAVANFWDAQVGWRHDSGSAPDQDWLAVGVSGLAPYWFELGATAYLGKTGQTALRLEGEYELLITQRLIMQPRMEFNAYGKSDEVRGIGAGPADLSAGVRVRYEFSRQFAPYVGIEWQRLLGRTADRARDEGGDTTDTRLVAGVRFWF